jgi:hypothetical protein
MDDTTRAELVEKWRARAAAFADYARDRRHDGDILEAQAADDVAIDYLAAAANLELGLEPEGRAA